MRQDRPSDARKLVGQRNDGNVLVRPGQEPACPPAKRRFSLDEVRQHGSCAMDQVLAKITIAAFADACSFAIRTPGRTSETPSIN